jgi:transketolase
VAEVLGETHPVPLIRVGVKDQFVETGDIPDLFAKYETRPEDIVRAAKEAMRLKDSLRVA